MKHRGIKAAMVASLLLGFGAGLVTTATKPTTVYYNTSQTKTSSTSQTVTSQSQHDYNNTTIIFGDASIARTGTEAIPNIVRVLPVSPDMQPIMKGSADFNGIPNEISGPVWELPTITVDGQAPLAIIYDGKSVEPGAQLALTGADTLQVVIGSYAVK